MNKKITISVIAVMLVILVSFLGITLYQNKDTNDIDYNYDKPVIKHEEVIEDISAINYEEELNKLKEEYNNEEIVGVLTVENTDFREIIMQTSDNDYYLDHTVYHSSDWRGQAFLDYRVDINDSRKLIIYGHNSGNHNLEFKVFENFYDESYINEHKHLYLQTDKEFKIYEIFSVYVEVSDWSYYNKMNFSTEQDYYNHILKLKNNSFYDTKVDITKDDEILIIQTCSYHSNYKSYENKFLLIIGKLVNN